MEIGLVGLGDTGLVVCRALVEHGHKVYAYDDSEARVAEAEAAGAVGLSSIEELVRMGAPRTVWVSTPAVERSENVYARLTGLLNAGDYVIDGDPSSSSDVLPWRTKLAAKRIHFFNAADASQDNAGVLSGGEPEAFQRLAPIVRLAAPKGV